MTAALGGPSRPASGADASRAGDNKSGPSRRRPCDVHEGASSSLWHRLPHARQRSRGRGHRARRLGTLADGGSHDGSRRRRVPRNDSDSAGDQRHAVSTFAPGNVCRTLAAGTGRHQHRPAVGSGAAPGIGVWGSVAAGNADAHRASRATSSGRRSTTPYRDIAKVLRLEEANARQVVTRARQHVANGRRMPATSTEHRRLLDTFIAAVQYGDIAGLQGDSLVALIRHKASPRSTSSRAFSRVSQVGASRGHTPLDATQSGFGSLRKGTSTMKLVIIGGTGLIGSKL